MGTPQALARRTGLFRRERRAGLTFLELLIAVSLAVLVTAVALLAWQSVVSGIHRQAEWRDAVLPAESALQAMARDLAGALVPFASPSNALVLATEPVPGSTQGLAALSLVTAEPDAAGAGDRAYTLARVRYGLAPSSRPAGGLALVRERQPEFPAGEPERQELVQGVGGFEVFLRGGEGWTNAWTASAPDRMPRLAKVRLTIRPHGQDHALEAVAAVPAGCRLEPPLKAAGP